MRAAANGHLDIVIYLVDHGVDVFTTDNNGETALVIAVLNGELEVVKYLVHLGIDGIDTNENGDQRALVRAAENDRLEIVKFFVDRGTDVNAPDNDGHIPLIQAAKYGNFGVVKYLVEQGADIKAVNIDGIMAIAVAAQCGHHEIHRMLARYASQSTPTLIETNSASTLGSSSSMLTISPFELNIKQPTESDISAADFLGTWLDASVALKLFVPDAANTSFNDEVTLWHQLRHPNVIKLYGACDIGHNLFVCELASKGPIGDYLKDCEPDNHTPWKYLYHAALGLAYLHERGIIHGDLRGSSIMIEDDGQAKLANFGLSNSIREIAECRGFVGSMRWQSPEMLEGGKASYASDVYALGVCIVEILTGEIPWQRFHELAIRRAKMIWEPELNFPPGQPARVSCACQVLLKQLCCHEPALRQSASACVRMLKDLVEEENSNQNRTTQFPTLTDIDNQYWNKEFAKHWAEIQSARNRSIVGAAECYLYKPIVDDLTQIYEAIQASKQARHIIEEASVIFKDALYLFMNVSQTALVVQLSSTRATGSNVGALRRRINALKRQFSRHQGQAHAHDDDAQFTDNRTSNSHNANETQIFISEVSKTWMILDELKTNEERVAFLSYLHSEINQHAENYSPDQLEILQRAYDNFKRSLDANEDFVTNLPVWFVPWYELSLTHGTQIGFGGFGSVHLAKWLDSDVIVKRLESLGAVDEQYSDAWTLTTSSVWSLNLQPIGKKALHEERRLFEHEVNIWFNLSHPHVVRLFGACHVGHQLFFVCEYASNGSLDNYLLDHPEEIWTKLYEAALGLLYLHERGIVHCDLKCNNIVVGSDGKAKVTDFGLSLAAGIDNGRDNEDSINSIGKNITGAWNWLAPELILGNSDIPTRESDVFLFGMCIIEAFRVVLAAHTEHEKREKLPPRVPWQHSDKETVKYFMRHEKHLPARPVECADNQWELVQKMCMFNPSERIQMCTVVDELSVLAGIHQSQQLSEGFSIISPLTDVLSITASARNLIKQERSVVADQGPRNKIYEIHQLLWTRVEDIQSRVNDNDIVNRLEVFAVDAFSKTKTIPAHSNSLMDFTELALQAYGLHRLLDKLLVAANLRTNSGKAFGKSILGWKLNCYEILGVESSVALQLLGDDESSTYDDVSTHPAIPT